MLDRIIQLQISGLRTLPPPGSVIIGNVLQQSYDGRYVGHKNRYYETLPEMLASSPST